MHFRSPYYSEQRTSPLPLPSSLEQGATKKRRLKRVSHSPTPTSFGCYLRSLIYALQARKIFNKWPIMRIDINRKKPGGVFSLAPVTPSASVRSLRVREEDAQLVWSHEKLGRLRQLHPPHPPATQHFINHTQCGRERWGERTRI